MFATARFFIGLAVALVRVPGSGSGERGSRRTGLAGLFAVAFACSLGGTISACGDDIRCPRGTSGDPCRPDGPVGDAPVPGAIARPDTALADIVGDVATGDATEPTDLSETPNDLEDDATPDDGAPAPDGQPADDAGSDATDGADAATHDDVGPDSAAAGTQRATQDVFITTPNTRARLSLLRTGCAYSGIAFRVRTPPSSTPPSAPPGRFGVFAGS